MHVSVKLLHRGALGLFNGDMPAGEIDLIEMSFRGGQFKGLSMEGFVDAGLADVEAELDFSVDLEPVLAEIALGLFFINESLLHLVLNYIPVIIDPPLLAKPFTLALPPTSDYWDYLRRR